MLADETAFLVDQRFVSAVGTLLAFGLCAVLDIFLEGAFHTVLPCIDAFAVQLERSDQLDHLHNGHTVAQHARDEFGIVPVFLVELLGKPLNGGLVSALVLGLAAVL